MPLDDADKQFITESITAAVTAHGANADKTTKGLLAKVAKEFEAKFKARDVDDEPVETDTDTDTDPDVEPEPKPAKGKFPAKESQADKKLAARLARLEKENVEAKAAQTKAENESKTNRLLGAAREQLGEAGVKNMKAALAILHASDARLRFTDDGEPGILFKRDGYEEVVPMAQGVEEWLKTDDGLGILPPKNVQGTGTGNAGASAVKGGKLDIAAVKAKLATAMTNL